MKTGVANPKTFSTPARLRAGMTLVEVVMALAIAVLTVVGIINGYVYCTTIAVKTELAEEANAQAMQRIEEARSVPWNISSFPVVDQLVATNFPDSVVTLDMPGTNTVGTLATNHVTLSQNASTPLFRTIHVDCVWRFNGGELITNSIETLRAADQ